MGEQTLGTFAALLAPISEAEFFSTYYEVEALHISRDDAALYRPLAGAIDLEQLFFQCKTWGSISLAGGDRALIADILASPPDSDRLKDAFEQGYTVVINDLQLLNLPVARLCRMIEARFLCRANINLYLTRANRPGLDVHYDDDDVIVLQLTGQKTWRTWPADQKLPMGEDPYTLGDVRGDGVVHVLRPGDLLYVPRGSPHCATANEENSLHLTISLNVLRWAHLLREWVLCVAAREPLLRHAVPPTVLRGEQALPEQIWRRFVDSSDPVSDAIDAVARAQTRLLSVPPRIPQPWRPFSHSTLTAETQVCVASDQMVCSTREPGLIVVRGIGAQFEFPEDLAGIVAHLEGATPFSAQTVHPELTLERKLHVVRTLVDRGLLVVVPPFAPQAGPAHDPPGTTAPERAAKTVS